MSRNRSDGGQPPSSEKIISLMSDEQKLILRWRASPLLFVRECIGVRPTNQQEGALVLLAELAAAKLAVNSGKGYTKKQKELSKKFGISIRSGHGTGKDAFLSWVYLWLLMCFPHPRGIVTAVSAAQLQNVLWAELSTWVRKSTGELWRYIDTQSDRAFIKGSKKDWFIEARTANVKTTEDEQVEVFAGRHAEYMIHSVDEASGVPNPVFRPLEGGMTGLMNMAIIIGNMTRSSGYFYDSHFGEDRANWIPLHWDCEKSNMDEVTGTHSMGNYVERMASKYGKDSNAYRIRVNGEPPIEDPDALIPVEWVMSAVNRDITPTEWDPTVAGIDPGGGGDPSIFLVRKGGKVEEIRKYTMKDSMELVGKVGDAIGDYTPDATLVDVIGIGHGVYYRLRELGYRRVFPVNVSTTSSNKRRFKRLRDELFWRLREMFEQRLISIPDDDELIGELCTIRYKEESDGSIKVEAKKEMRSRGVESPNKADALMLTFSRKDSTYNMKARDKYEPDDEEPDMGKGGWMSA